MGGAMKYDREEFLALYEGADLESQALTLVILFAAQRRDHGLVKLADGYWDLPDMPSEEELPPPDADLVRGLLDATSGKEQAAWINLIAACYRRRNTERAGLLQALMSRRIAQ